MLKKKIDAGVYEPLNSSYQLCWFCVMKKDSKALCSIHSLKPLNKVMIQHSGVVPIPEHLAEQFGGYVHGGMLNLYVAFNERKVAESSHDLRTFQTPFSALRIVTLPMGWTNSVPIMYNDVTYILQPKILHITIPYINYAPIKGLKLHYQLSNGVFKTIPDNPTIRHFIWEHLKNLNCIVQHMKYCGGTFSGPKLFLCIPEITVLGHQCNIDRHMADPTRIDVISKWGPCNSPTEVKVFLRTIGVCHIFI